MLLTVQTMLSPETPHIGAGEPFITIAVGLLILGVFMGIGLGLFPRSQRPSPPPTDEELGALVRDALSHGAADPDPEAPYADIQARCRAHGVTPPG